MKSNDRNKAQEETIKNNDNNSTGGTCAINNAVCDPKEDCKTGLFDKTGPM